MLPDASDLPGKDTPPPPLPPLPTARGRSTPALAGYTPGRRTVPLPRRYPRAHPRLVEARARAARLRNPRPARLPYRQLHADHDHNADDVAALADFRRYVEEGGQLSIPPPSPWARLVYAAALDRLESQVATHRWGALFRLDDVRAALDLPRPRRGLEREGRSQF